MWEAAAGYLEQTTGTGHSPYNCLLACFQDYTQLPFLYLPGQYAQDSTAHSGRGLPISISN